MVREDLREGRPFPDLRLPDHTVEHRTLSAIAGGEPLVLCFVRGWWCPKEQVRLASLVAMQEEIQREYGKIAVVTTDGPYVNGALRAGLGARFPFLSDEQREVATELDLLELTDAKHTPFLPFTFVLDSLLAIHRIWCGFWYWGNPTPDELRLALREITRREQPTFDPQRAWSSGGAPPGAGIDAPAVWIREDEAGREIWRGRYEGAPLEVGDEHSRSAVDGRSWVVHSLEREGERVAYRLRKEGTADPTRTVRHHIAAPTTVHTR
jgi:peroxiredoxin